MKVNAYAVAEAGSNWTDLNSALELVEQAAQCGAVGVKFQLFRADSLYNSERAPKQYEAVKGHELPLEWIPKLQDKAHECRIELGLSIFAPELFGEIKKVVPKLASGELGPGSLSLRQEAYRFCKKHNAHLHISTGTHTDEEIEAVLDEAGMNQTTAYLYHCVSKYPAAEADYNPAVLLKFKEHPAMKRLCLSDHTLGVPVDLIREAVSFGYRLFEKHFRLDTTSDTTPDYGVSLAPAEFKAYVSAINEACDYWTQTRVMDKEEAAERQWMWRGEDGLRPNL